MGEGAGARAGAGERVLNEETLVEDGPSYKRLAVKLSEFEGHQLLDIRYWYLQKKSGEYRATQKGVAIKGQQYKLITRTLVENSEKILKWLDQATVPEHVLKYTEGQQAAAEKLLARGGEVATSTMHWPRDPHLFNVKHSGNVDHVALNSACSFIESFESKLRDVEQADVIWSLLGHLFAAFRRACSKYQDAPATDPVALFEQVELEWSRILESTLDGN